MLASEIIEDIIDYASPLRVSSKYLVEDGLMLFRLYIEIKDTYINTSLYKDYILGNTNVPCKFETSLLGIKYGTTEKILKKLVINSKNIKLFKWEIIDNYIGIRDTGIKIPLDKHALTIANKLDELNLYVKSLLIKISEYHEINPYEEELVNLKKRKNRILHDIYEEEIKIKAKIRKIKNKKVQL